MFNFGFKKKKKKKKNVEINPGGLLKSVYKRKQDRTVMMKELFPESNTFKKKKK